LFYRGVFWRAGWVGGGGQACLKHKARLETVSKVDDAVDFGALLIDDEVCLVGVILNNCTPEGGDLRQYLVVEGCYHPLLEFTPGLVLNVVLEVGKSWNILEIP
jgi:hypothetical protein